MAGKGIAIRGNRRLSGVSGGVAALSSLWGLLTATASTISAVNNAPPVWRFIVNTPDAIPWLLAAMAVVLFVWTFLPRKDEEAQEEPGPGISTALTTHGPNSPNVGTVHGNVYFGPPNPPERQPAKSPYGYDVGKLGDGLERVARRLERAAPRSRGHQILDRMEQEEARRCPEMPIWQAVEHVARVIGETNTADSFPEARRQIRQAAADIRIDVWGQKDIPPAHFKDDRHSSIWTPIEADYWHDHELNPMATVERFDDTAHTWREDLHSLHGDRYWSLRVRERQIKARWPEAKPSAPPPRPVHQPPSRPPLITDLPLAGVLARLYKIYRKPSDQAALPAFYRKIDLAITDALAEHRLNLSGRVGNFARRRIEPIDREFATIDHLRGELTQFGDNGQVFSDLKFNKSEIDRIWPEPPRTTNDGKP